MEKIKGKYALVTGSSSGIGAEFARLLAEKGCHLVLVARREERLEEMREELEEKEGIKVEVIAMDLARRESARELYEEVKKRDVEVEVLINNAGFGVYGEFAENDWEKEEQMLQLNMLTLVHLTKLFLKDMLERDLGYILQVSSIGSHMPCPTYSLYCASKSFVTSFGQALNYELKKTNVKTSTLEPGVTRTEFFDAAGQDLTLYQKLSMMECRKVCEIGLKSLLKGKASRISGLLNSLSMFFLRFFPLRLKLWMAEWTMSN